MTPKQKERCVKLVAAWSAARTEMYNANTAFRALVRELELNPEWWDGRGLKAAKTAAFRAREREAKARKALDEFSAKQESKLFSYSSGSETAWLVGGWAAS